MRIASHLAFSLVVLPLTGHYDCSDASVAGLDGLPCTTDDPAKADATARVVALIFDLGS